MNVIGLSQPKNWDFMTNRGYSVIPLDSTTKISELLPGDLLFFTNAKGKFSHTGIFWDQKGTVNGQSGPAFISSVGYQDCDADYNREKQGNLTGVSAAILNQTYWQPKMKLVIRFLRSNFITFSADGTDYNARMRANSFLSASLDTNIGEFFIQGCTDTLFTPHFPACMSFYLEGMKDKGTFDIVEQPYDSNKHAQFNLSRDTNFVLDSMVYTATTPPDWWKGSDTPPSTGGTATIETFSKTKVAATIIGSFDFKANSYYKRTIDSTYYVDTTKVTTKVTVYKFLPTEIKGKFGGVVGYKN